MVAASAYSSITVELAYDYNLNMVLFDGIQLFKEAFGTSYTYDANGNVITVTDLQGGITDYTVGSSGVAAAPNPNNEKMERHHIVEQCQVKKSGFSRTDIQGSSNLIDIPRSLHQRISGYYSSKPYTLGLRVRDALVGSSFEDQRAFGWSTFEKFAREYYGF